MNTFVRDDDLIFNLRITNTNTPKLIIGLTTLHEFIAALPKDTQYTLSLLPWDIIASIDNMPHIEDGDLYQVFKQAVIWHGEQLYGDRLYAEHLVEVWRELIEVGASPLEQKVGILHDVGEDVEDGLAKIRSTYGQYVYEQVDACSGFGSNRQERSMRIHNLLLQRPYAVNAKIADRLVNMRNSIGKMKYMKMYERELYQWQDILKLPNVLPELRQRFEYCASQLTYNLQLNSSIHEKSI